MSNDNTPRAQRTGWYFPMPQRQYFAWILFFHLFHLGWLGLMLWLTWRDAELTERAQWGVTASLGLQLLIYIACLVIKPKDGWPLPARWLWAYFLSNIGAVLLAWWFDPQLGFMLWPYMGHMFGILPFRAALPGATALYLLINVLDGQLTWPNLWGWFGSSAFWIWFAMSLASSYIYHLSTASQQRARLIEELTAANQALAAAQEKEAELAVLRERERLARDMHDGLGHALVALAVQLEAVQRLYPVDPERASAQIEEMKTLTRSSMNSLRRTVAGLRTPELADRPLAAALQSLCTEVSKRSQLAIHCQVVGALETLSDAMAEALWRVAQEALTNVEKHAQASQVEVVLNVAPTQATLRIADNGVGLPTQADLQTNHFGLRGMRERVEGLGGVLHYSTGSQINGSRGAEIQARIPLVGVI
jgi:signal transduction histidine kinase